MTSIAFTGGNSWVSQEVSKYIETKSSEIKVTLLVRDETIDYFGLTQFSKNNFDHFDFIFHVAHDYSNNAQTFAKIRSEITKLLQTSKSIHIFLSSMSASMQNPSVYSSFKIHLENIFQDSKGFILRSGFIYKDLEQNIYSRPLSDFINTFSCFPITFLSESSYFLTSINSIGDKILSIVEAYPRKDSCAQTVMNVYDFGPLDFLELQEKVGIKRLLRLPIPALPIKYLLLKLERHFPAMLGVDKAVNLLYGMFKD